MQPFSPTESIRAGWTTFSKRPWFFIGVTLLVGAATAIVSGVDASFGEQGALSALGSLSSFLLTTFIAMCTTAFFLKAHEVPMEVESSALWYPQPYLKYLGTKLLVAILIVFGLILFIVPGIIVGLMFMFAAYFVVDRGLAPLEAMAESRRITAGHRWHLFGFALLLILLNILGILCLFVGLLVTTPVTALAVVHAYRSLSRDVR